MEKSEKLAANVVEGMEDTLTIFDDYKQKFVEAMQQEKERIRQQALQESSSTIDKAEQKARQIYEKAIINAEKESAKILTESSDVAKLIISEAERYIEAITELKRDAEKEIDAATVTLQKEADIITETMHKSEKTINGTKGKLQSELEESARVINEVKQKLEQIITAAEDEIKKDDMSVAKATESTVSIRSDREETAGHAEVKEDDYSLKRNNDKPFAGTLFLDVYSNNVQSKKFQQSLNKIPDLEVSLVDDSIEDKTRITVFISRPIPLLKVLNEMALVTKAVSEKESIRVDLEARDLWQD